MAENIENCAGVYAAIDPKFTGKTEGVWSATVDGDLIASLPTDVSGSSEETLQCPFIMML